MDATEPSRTDAGRERDAALVAAQFALDDDLDVDGDVTCTATVPPHAVGRMLIVAREPGVVAGAAAFVAVFDLIDPRVSVDLAVCDGEVVAAGALVAEVAGPLRSVLTGTGSAVALLAHLSGIATRTRSYVDAVAAAGCEIGATRHTTPGLRTLEHAAIRAGGGTLERSGLSDGLVVGAAHAAAAGSLAAATGRALAAAGDRPVVVEVRTAEDVDDATDAGARCLRIVGADPQATAALVQQIRQRCLDTGRPRVEVAADLGPDAVRDYATTGVDRVVIDRLVANAAPIDVEAWPADRPLRAASPSGVALRAASPSGVAPSADEPLFTDHRGED